MKGITGIISLLIVFQGIFFAQNTAISDDNGYIPHSSALLDVYSLNKGLLIPRLTSAERTAITSPASGLLVYDITVGDFYSFDGTGWTRIFSGQLWSKSGNIVYLTDTADNVGIGLSDPGTKLIVRADASNGIDESVFAVLNNDGDTIFAVYPEGVRIWVNDDGGSKANGSRGGFAVGGFSPAKAGFTNEYLRVTPDSVRIYIDDEYTASKLTGSRGGFAVGGFSPAKGSLTNHYLFVQDDSTRVYIADTLEGFGVENLETGTNSRIMKLNKENYLIGHESGTRLTSGKYNSYLGFESGYSSTSASDNVFIGYQAGYKDTSGLQNNFIGYRAAFNNTSGRYNLANGPSAAYSNTTGEYNTATGFQALHANTTGNYNTAEGFRAMYLNINGNLNAAFGYYALYKNANGNYNTATGYQALYSNTSGYRNTATGYRSLNSNTTGDYNTALGYYAYVSGTIYNNSTAIGYLASISGDNQIRVGNDQVTSIGGYQDWTNFSDGRFKKDVREDVPGLDFILKLRPVTYHLDHEKIAELLHIPDSLIMNGIQTPDMTLTGFIAQEVETAAIETGYDFSGIDKPPDSDGFYGLRYAQFTVPVVKAVQEQQETIEERGRKIAELEEIIDNLSRQILHDKN